MNVLIIEDDPGIARGLQVNLEIEKHSVSWSENLHKANNKITTETFDLILLDVNLPDGSGFDFLKDFRKQFSTPVIMLTAMTDEDSVVRGLQLGANDYIRKPFGNRELMARIKTVSKSIVSNENIISFNELKLFKDERLVKINDQNIELNRREFDILQYFMERADKVITRDALLTAINKDGEIFDRTIDSHISHLRNKLKQATPTSIKISSIYGVGYRLEKIK